MMPANIVSALMEPAFAAMARPGTSAQSPFSITYSIAGAAGPGGRNSSYLDTLYTGWAAPTAAQKADFRKALASFEDIINVRFLETTTEGQAALTLGKVDLPSGLHGQGGFNMALSGNSVSKYNAHAVFDADETLPFSRILHELGHALGLKHSFSGANVLPEAFDNNAHTVMSYNADPLTYAPQDELMLYDILALQSLWGANTLTARGNDTYDRLAANDRYVVWDGGGRDCFNFRDKRVSETAIDLREGQFSHVDWDTGGRHVETIVGVAFGTTIENAVGGLGANNSIIGNGSNNRLEGGSLADFLRGWAGKDILIGKDGNDRLSGDTGHDRLVGGGGNDKLSGGADNDRLIGGNDNDLLLGGRGVDLLDGGRGNDRLLGGAQADTFVIRANSGDDRIKDFEDDTDTIRIDDRNWGGGLSVGQVLSRYASVSDGGVVFEFANARHLTFIAENFT